MNIQNIIKNKNIKLTSARRTLLEILANAPRPLSYEDIKSDISMDKATFYRNITKFEEEHIINSFESNDKKRYYEIFKSPHPHFICSHCNTIECITPSIECHLEEGYIIENILIKGICKKCSL